MPDYTALDAKILECLQPLRKNDTATRTSWMAEAALCFSVTGQRTSATKRIVRRRLRTLASLGVVMWIEIAGVVCWALDEGQYRPDPPQLDLPAR